MDDLRALKLDLVFGQLWVLLTNPTSNLQAALVLYGIIGLLVLIMLVAGIVIIMALPDDEEVQAAPPVSGSLAPVVAGTSAAALQEPPGQPRSPWVVSAVVAVLFVAVWVLAGYTTSNDAVCSACHVETAHSKAARGQDPHVSTGCVSCHEPGGILGRYVTSVPSRVLHFVDGATAWSSQAGYGHVASSTCSNCHSRDIAGITVDKVTGVRMSHKEPLAASATCLDCHVLVEGVVSAQTVGMSTCLRCHNAVTASSACSTCHDKKTAAAARARRMLVAQAQIEDVRCGPECHNEPKECNWCHGGVPLPHTKAFMRGAHAREGAINFWFNGGQTCGRCHTVERRTCFKCHTSLLPNAHPVSMASDHQRAAPETCNSCHISWANPGGRNFCGMCHIVAPRKGHWQ